MSLEFGGGDTRPDQEGRPNQKGHRKRELSNHQLALRRILNTGQEPGPKQCSCWRRPKDGGKGGKKKEVSNRHELAIKRAMIKEGKDRMYEKMPP